MSEPDASAYAPAYASAHAPAYALVPCAACGVEVELAGHTVQLIAHLNGVLWSRREPSLEDNEVVRCAPCYRRFRAAGSPRRVADNSRWEYLDK